MFTGEPQCKGKGGMDEWNVESQERMNNENNRAGCSPQVPLDGSEVPQNTAWNDVRRRGDYT